MYLCSEWPIFHGSVCKWVKYSRREQRGFREALQSSRNDAPFSSLSCSLLLVDDSLHYYGKYTLCTYYSHLSISLEENHFSTISQSHILDRLLTSIKERNYAKPEYSAVPNKRTYLNKHTYQNFFQKTISIPTRITIPTRKSNLFYLFMY